MNVERETKLTFVCSLREVLAAMRKMHPEEFLLGQLSEDPKLTTMETNGHRLSITGIRRSQGPAEITFNRMQRVDPGE
jgi:hypothetical protein